MITNIHHTPGWFHKRFCTLTPNFRTLRPTFEKLFTGAKVQCREQKFGLGRKTVNEFNPGGVIIKFYGHSPQTLLLNCTIINPHL